MDAAAIEQRYQDLLSQLNQAMLANNHQRVPLLRRIMAHLGHPDHYYHVIHIAGTNGKGSTGAMLVSILRAQGYQVGRFSSPAINDAREQLQCNGTWISPAEFIDTYDEILPVLQNMGLDANDVSIFEWFFLISVVWFRNQDVQWAVIEAGLGGLYDATNALASPQLTVFTKIALDHTAILGPTITAIAQNKSKIIKPHTTVVTLNDQHSEALAVLQTEALNQGVRLVTAKHAQLTVTEQTLTQTVVDAHSQLFDWTQLTVGLSGTYQLQNLRLVLTVVAVLQQQQVNLTNGAIRRGLQHVNLPGRLTVLQEQPLIIADGAHNPDGITALVASIKQLLADRQLIWVVGVLQDKAYPKMLAKILPAAEILITNTPANPERALSATKLAQTATNLLTPAFMAATNLVQLPTILTATTITDALAQAKQQATANSAIIVTGSFYVIRELQQAGWPGLGQ